MSRLAVLLFVTALFLPTGAHGTLDPQLLRSVEPANTWGFSYDQQVGLRTAAQDFVVSTGEGRYEISALRWLGFYTPLEGPTQLPYEAVPQDFAIVVWQDADGRPDGDPFGTTNYSFVGFQSRVVPQLVPVGPFGSRGALSEFVVELAEPFVLDDDTRYWITIVGLDPPGDRRWAWTEGPGGDHALIGGPYPAWTPASSVGIERTKFFELYGRGIGVVGDDARSFGAIKASFER